MLLPNPNRGEAGRGAPRHDLTNPPQAHLAHGKAALVVSEILLTMVMLWAIGTGSLAAGPIHIPNASFESPVVPIEFTPALPDMDYWQKSPEPGWYASSPDAAYPWDTRMGTFYNFPAPDTFIDNCDGTQAAFLFAFPDVAIFQDYNSIYGTNTTPSHAFNASFNVNRAYTLTVGLLGGSGGMYYGASLQLSLYYRDASSNMVIVAATTITNSAELFPTNTHFVDFSVYVPGVRATDPWAGQNIGVQIASTTTYDLRGGYWDVDNARLTETLLPTLTDLGLTNGQFGFTLQSQPGLRFDILATTNPALPISNWTNLGTLTNVTGITPFLDPATSLDRRFYRARQLD